MSKFIEVVPFHNYGIPTLREGDSVLVVMRPLVEMLGLAWQGQLERLKRHPILSEGVSVTLTPSGHGMQEMVALDLKLLPGYLTTIQSERIKEPEIRERVILFQREAFEVLFQHFFGGRGPVGRQAVAATTSDAIKLIEAIKRATLPAERDYLHAMLAQLSEVRGLPCPPISELVEPDRNREQAAELLAKIEALIAEGALTNHHRREDRIAINLPQLRRLGVAVERGQMDCLRHHPRFMATCQVNCSDGRIRRCWVFFAPEA